MKKIFTTTMVLSLMGFGSIGIAKDNVETGTATVNKPVPQVVRTTEVVQAEIAEVQKQIAVKKEFATRAKFTEEGEAKYKQELAALENKLAQLKKEPQIVICVFPPRPPEKEKFGIWLDQDGFIIPGPKTADYIDTDGDRIDDRLQCKPGAPAGKLRPQKPGGKPETGGPDPKPEKPGEGGAKPGGQLGGGERPKPPAPIRPILPPRPKIPEELTTKMDAYKEAQDVLRGELKAKIEALGDDASKADIKSAAETFKSDNQDRIDAQLAAAKEIHEGLKANRPKHDKGERPEPPAAVKEKADAMKGLHQLLGKARQDLHESLKNASEEERESMIVSFKDAQKEHHQQLKQAKKDLREAIRDNAPTGDRRSED